MRGNVLLCLILLGFVSSSYLERQIVPQDTGARITEPAGDKLLTAPIDQVVALRFHDPGGWIVLSRSGVWQVEGDAEARVDTNAISQLLSTLETTRTIRTFDSDPPQLGQYGLTAPSMIVGVRHEGEGEFHDLLLGDKNPVSNAVYAKWAHTSQVFIIGAYFETLTRVMLQKIREGRRAEGHNHKEVNYGTAKEKY